MNFLKIKTSWSNAEFSIIKLCMASAYILIGSYFHDFFKNYYPLLFVIFGITLVWFVYLWQTKMKKEKQE
ncbi:hypothetical protein IW18_07130 [Flavobacterium hibernum]|uniref:Uncharacterized protein n=1 Tax=Flavobacterium hibernum TaxID=37752 RepID=A0A0D0EX60_9FLAO|nr:hypothetical protein IW18_07130 [Flavobacterium hibernum]OXA84428.1 hypothetical protein B0A73_19730 [Flavobacterium hibernum]STO10162.1 Uncharacterised protein [Flavobacterium hibernum]